MQTVSDSSPAITPILLAGLVVLTFRLLREYSFEMPDVTKVLEALDVSRSRAYEVSDAIASAIADVVRPRGRPPGPEPEPGPDYSRALVATIRDYLMENPGAVSPGHSRREYATDFRWLVIGLRDEYPELSLDAFSEAVGVPYDTVRDWLRADCTPPPPRDDEPPASASRSSSDLDRGRIAHIIALWKPWRGSLAAFKRALAKNHALFVTFDMLRAVLRIEGKRSTTARTSKPSPEAIRGTLQRFFPGAQWVGDGKTIDITIGPNTHRFVWELIVDTHDAAHIGFDVRDAEDGEGVVNALKHADVTTGGSPCAVLLDNRPSNHTEEVAEAIEELGAIKMSSTLFRAQNKAPVEGAFGLFAQKMPPIALPHAPERELARCLVAHILFAYCVGRNDAPRKGGKTAAGKYGEARPTEADTHAASEHFKQIQAKIDERNDRDAQLYDPICRQLLDDAFERLGLSDPEGNFVPAIAAHGIDAVIEAIAVLEEALERKNIECPERYLLGIAKRIAERNRQTKLYDRLVDLRGLAGDIAIKHLVRLDQERLQTLDLDEYISQTLADAVNPARPFIQRAFFRRWLLARLEHLEDSERQLRCRAASRKVAVSYGIGLAERQELVSALALIVTPLTQRSR